MKKSVWIQEIGIAVCLKKNRHYRLYSLDDRQNKAPIGQIFKAREYCFCMPEKRENGMKYEIQRVKCKPGTHTLKE